MIATQEWTHSLTVMQQSVLLTAIRGPDGLHKDHVSKLMLRWFRRCTLMAAFEGTVLTVPYSTVENEGGSFTGPSIPVPKYTNEWPQKMWDVLTQYLRSLDEVPHHFHLHLMHAAEIIGYKHPDNIIREWWNLAYRRMANDMHLIPETSERMNMRLGDKHEDWLAAEEVTADGPQ